MIHRHDPGSTRRLTLGADKGYDAAELVADLRQACVTPHVAQRARHSAIDGRTARHKGYHDGGVLFGPGEDGPLRPLGVDTVLQCIFQKTCRSMLNAAFWIIEWRRCGAKLPFPNNYAQRQQAQHRGCHAKGQRVG